MNEITITHEDGTTSDWSTEMGFWEFIGARVGRDEDEIIAEMFSQRFIVDHATDPTVTWYHDGKTVVEKVSVGRVRRYDLTNF